MAKRAKKAKKKSIKTLAHKEAKRPNIPTAEHQSVMTGEEQSPVPVTYKRNRDLDPQFVWRGKDEQDWSDLVVPAPPLYIQEKVHPKVLIDDLARRSRELEAEAGTETAGTADDQADLFADFNGLPDDGARTEFYRHDANWSNRMILGDCLQAMTSLAEREGLRGKVQCIYIDPPYGIKFNSNFQWSTTSRDVTDGKTDHITREPEQVKAFRDTWRDGIHSYLTYLRDRLTVARDLLTESGSVFVQIGDENVHRVRAVMDEVFGDTSFVGEVAFIKTSGLSSNYLSDRFDYLLWYGKDPKHTKFRQPYLPKTREDGTASTYTWIRDTRGDYRGMTKAEKSGATIQDGYSVYKADNITSQGNPFVEYMYEGKNYRFRSKTPPGGLSRLERANRLHVARNSLQYVRRLDDFPLVEVSKLWSDTGTGSFTDDKLYVVQTGTKTIQRCILMTTDPGDLVLDPTCGSGTTAYVAEQWGRRWITMDTSRVALALARARIMGARYPYYLLADSREGQRKEAELARKAPSEMPTYGDIRQGFVYERVPHITLKAIANNAEIDVIHDKFQETLERLRTDLNAAAGTDWQEWQVPREEQESWSQETRELHAEWWKTRIERQREMDASIAAHADYEYLYDKPYEDKSVVRVAGPFTVESLSPHRVLAVDENDEPIMRVADSHPDYGADNFVKMIFENLNTAGVQQADKKGRIKFTSLTPWPGHWVCAEGRYIEGDAEGANGAAATEKRAAIFIGPEFGTVSRPDLVAAVREAADAKFDVLIACAFNYDAHSSDFNKLGKIQVLKARMNADLHMAEDLKNTGEGNLFIIFGEPDIEILRPGDKDATGDETDDGAGDTMGDNEIRVRVRGVDVFHPQQGKVQSDGPEGIACWFIDTDYNEESFFVRQAYFLGANDPYKKLKTTLKAEINQEAWATLNRNTSRPFPKPQSGRIAVKVINHLGDEVMKVYRV